MLDHEALLAPIDSNAPCGQDLSLSPLFDGIKEARRFDDPTLEQGDWEADLKVADWALVIRSSARLLQEQTKDLRLAIWITEAATRQHGFAGLHDGLRLTTALCERYWPDLHPCEEGEYGPIRVSHIAWLLKHLPSWILALPALSGPDGDYSWEVLRGVHRNGADAARGAGTPSPEQINEARRSTSREHLQQLVLESSACVEALEVLSVTVDAVAGDAAPSFSACRELLQDIASLAMRMARDAGVLTDAAVSADSSPVPEDRRNSEAPAPTGQIRNRQDALEMLRLVAAWFRRTEPHSPVAYLADKAAHWGEMPLHDWLRRVIKDEGTLASLEDLLDVPDTRDH